MNKRILGWGAGVFALISAATGTAHAFDQERYGSFVEADGNDSIYGAFSLDGDMQNTFGTIGFFTPTGFSSLPYLTSNSRQSLDTDVKMFGLAAKPVTAVLSSEAYWQRALDGSDIYTPLTHANITLLGSTIYASYGSSTTCTSSPRARIPPFVFRRF